jgi:molybdenum transport protein
MAPEQVAEAVRAIAALEHRPPIAATGGIHEGNAAAYAAAGADVLVTSAPYAAPPIDVKVRMSEG